MKGPATPSLTIFRRHELTVIRDLVLEHRNLFLEKWNAYSSGQQ
jgi:hypothetical protein